MLAQSSWSPDKIGPSSRATLSLNTPKALTSSLYFIIFQSRSNDLVFEDVDEDFDQDLGQLSLGTCTLSLFCGCCKPLVLQCQSFNLEKTDMFWVGEEFPSRYVCQLQLEACYNVLQHSLVVYQGICPLFT